MSKQKEYLPHWKESKRYHKFTSGEHTNNWNPWITNDWLISPVTTAENETLTDTIELHQRVTLPVYAKPDWNDDGARGWRSAVWFDAVGRLFDGLGIEVTQLLWSHQHF